MASLTQRIENVYHITFVCYFHLTECHAQAHTQIHTHTQSFFHPHTIITSDYAIQLTFSSETFCALTIHFL